MSSNVQIDAWAKKKHVRGWLGVFASDELPERVPATPWSLVVNYQDHFHPGDHWCSAWGSNGRAYWFSSYGLAPDGADPLLGDVTHFRRWLSRIAQRGWDYNKVQVQNYVPGSDACGQFSLWACHTRSGPKENPAAWSWASRNYWRNDRLVKELVRL